MRQSFSKNHCKIKCKYDKTNERFEAQQNRTNYRYYELDEYNQRKNIDIKVLTTLPFNQITELYLIHESLTDIINI